MEDLCYIMYSRVNHILEKNPQQGQHKKSKKKENRQTKRNEDRYSLGQNTQKPTYSLKTC